MTTLQLERQDSILQVAQDVTDIFGSLLFVRFEQDDVWTPGCASEEWNDAFVDEYGRFSYPPAKTIPMYRKVSLGDENVCTFADAAGVKDTGLHVWLHVCLRR